MKKRSYFYKNTNGEIKKYIYCSLCLKGPFTQEQKNVEVFNFKSSLHFCLDCAKLNFREKLNEMLGTQKITKSSNILENEQQMKESVTFEDAILDSELIKEIADISADLSSEKEDDILERVDKEIKTKKVVLKKEQPIKEVVVKKEETKKIEKEIEDKISIDQLNTISAKQIIEKVKKITKISITINVKNKQQIVKTAFKIFTDHKIFHV